MEKKVASFKKHEIFMADKSCLNEIANFRNQGELFSSLIFFHRGKITEEILFLCQIPDVQGLKI